MNFSDQKLKEVRFHETLATHRNILKIIHAWEERERLYIQTELCESKYVTENTQFNKTNELSNFYLYFQSLLDYSAENQITQPMIWHFLYQISQV